MMLWVFGYLNGRLVVSVQDGRGTDKEAHLLKQIAQPNNFLASFHCSNMLCLSGCLGNKSLKLGASRNDTSTHLDHISTSRVSRILATTMVSITECGEQPLAEKGRSGA